MQTFARNVLMYWLWVPLLYTVKLHHQLSLGSHKATGSVLAEKNISYSMLPPCDKKLAMAWNPLATQFWTFYIIYTYYDIWWFIQMWSDLSDHIQIYQPIEKKLKKLDSFPGAMSFKLNLKALSFLKITASFTWHA